MNSVEHIHPIHELILPPMHQEVREEDQLFWKQQGFQPQDIPKKIIIATASTRKLLMSNVLLNIDISTHHFTFSAWGDEKSWGEKTEKRAAYLDALKDHQLKLQDFFGKYIPNGDGSYKAGPILLGYYHGVRVFGESTDGESKSGTDPIQQAELKAKNLAGKYKKLGENVIVVSGDSMEFVGEERVPHGKPSGEFQFRARLEGEADSDYEHAKKTAFQKFMEEYVHSTYVGQQVSTSASGIVAVSVRPDKKRAKIHRTQVGFSSHYLELPDGLVPDPDAAGGALNQQIAFGQQSTVFETLTADKEIWEWIVYCQITGAPIFAMLAAAIDVGRRHEEHFGNRVRRKGQWIERKRKVA